jgi:hypothetical protein
MDAPRSPTVNDPVRLILCLPLLDGRTRWLDPSVDQPGQNTPREELNTSTQEQRGGADNERRCLRLVDARRDRRPARRRQVNQINAALDAICPVGWIARPAIGANPLNLCHIKPLFSRQLGQYPLNFYFIIEKPPAT